jgi:hypothetical protein
MGLPLQLVLFLRGPFLRFRRRAALLITAVPKPRRALLAVVLALTALSAVAPPTAMAARGPLASASSYRLCRQPLGYAPKNGGYALIIEQMRVQRITCRRAAKIGGAYYAGDPVPPGWSCSYSEADYLTHCRYRSSRHAFRFAFGGDAGRAQISAVRTCRGNHDAEGLATILSVRNMSCAGAVGALERGDFLSKNPIGLGAKAKIGGFRCRVYEDDTPPGPSDVDEKLRCVHGRKAFRYRYAV